jgi:hypothetical protein
MSAHRSAEVGAVIVVRFGQDIVGAMLAIVIHRLRTSQCCDRRGLRAGLSPPCLRHKAQAKPEG